MTEKQYKKLLIDTIQIEDNEDKDKIIELLKISTISFQKEYEFTYHLPDHRKEHIIISIIPEKLQEIKKYKDYIDSKCREIYLPNDDYEYWGIFFRPGILNTEYEDVSQEILFEDIQKRIVEEIRDAKFLIWIAMAWFTNPVIYRELLKKKQKGLDIKIIIDDNEVNDRAPFKLEDDFETYRVDIESRYKNIMHRKFCVIDLDVAMHGTFNFTNAANYNKENWDIDHNRDTARKFAEEFVKMRKIANSKLDF